MQLRLPDAERVLTVIAFFTVAALLYLVAGCAPASQITVRACGVIEDDLKTVNATTAQGQQRLDIHYVRGSRAKCW